MFPYAFQRGFANLSRRRSRAIADANPGKIIKIPPRPRALRIIVTVDERTKRFARDRPSRGCGIGRASAYDYQGQERDGLSELHELDCVPLPGPVEPPGLRLRG